MRWMSPLNLTLSLIMSAILMNPPTQGAEPAAGRFPAVPLVTHDPYFAVWSFDDKLTDNWPRHWTGTIHAMAGLARIDGKPFRFMGQAPAEVPAMQQQACEVLPTRSIYRFAAGGVELKVTFLSPLLPGDLEMVSRPVSYVSFEAKSIDGATHDVAVYLDITGEWAVNKNEQQVVWSREKIDGLSAMKIGTKEQPVLAKKGDNLRIDWGYAYLALPADASARTAIASDKAARSGFAADGSLPKEDDARMPRAVQDQWPVMAAAMDLGKVGAQPVARRAMIAYDDGFSIQYMQKNLKAWWTRNSKDMPTLLAKADKEYADIARRCEAFDAELLADLRKAGGDTYATLCSLAHRQAISAHKLVDDGNGTPLFFSKENFSNGCIATVDISYPSAPMFLLFNPALLKGMTTPILDYAGTPRWKFPFAPHDLGTYPLANGQVYGGGERTERDQMPVEECGNMLIMVAALAHVEGNADYAGKYWPVFTKWAEYLKEKGLDPENQLCTDDFAGHLAHNTNLSIKAIVALGGYAQLAEKLGKADDAKAYRKAAEEMAKQWVKMADDGDHYRLTFDKPGTWSQKYNLVWDKLLGLNLFPADVARKEVAYYKTKQNKYGLPLDSRIDTRRGNVHYTKIDWILWSATMAENPADFRAFVEPLGLWLRETPARVPMTDWYDTLSGKMVGFQARSVVGGLYIKMLADPELAGKWAKRAAPVK